MCSPEAVAGIDDRCYRPLVEFFLAGSETRIAALRRRACGSPLPGMVSFAPLRRVRNRPLAALASGMAIDLFLAAGVPGVGCADAPFILSPLGNILASPAGRLPFPFLRGADT